MSGPRRPPPRESCRPAAGRASREHLSPARGGKRPDPNRSDQQMRTLMYSGGHQDEAQPRRRRDS
eukprot:2841125-Prymnesium_polylepis.1